MDLNKIGRKLYLDDIRVPTQTYPDTLNCQWIIAKSYLEFIQVIEKQGVPQFISFDHDLSLEHYADAKSECSIPYNIYNEKTGLHCAKWLVGYCMDKGLRLPDYKVHSMNPVGRTNIRGYLDGVKKVLNESESGFLEVKRTKAEKD